MIETEKNKGCIWPQLFKAVILPLKPTNKSDSNKMSKDEILYIL